MRWLVRSYCLVLCCFVWAAVPAWAWACPSCATRERPGVASLALVFAMIAVPYVVTAVVLKVIRRLDREEEQCAGSPRP